MRKKLFGLFLCGALMAGLTACSNNEEANPSTAESSVETSSAENTSAEDTTQNDKTDEQTETTENTDEEATDNEEASIDEENEDTSSDENEAGDSDEDDLAAKLAAMFREEIANSTDIYAIAEKLSSEEVTGYSCGVMEVEEGYLTGFDDEVKGFNKGVNFGPWIGTIPFVGYIFEVDDAESFKAELESLANPRWNICTEAQEPVFEIYENYVFVTMVPMPQEF